MAHYSFIALLLLLLQVIQVLSHGRLMNPPARNSMWRIGFPNPVNYNDNALYCGGYGVQWSNKVNGTCGVCGDSWMDPTPRHHETGGRYANGLIGRRYTSGQVIDVKIELTANHGGFFVLKLCPLNGNGQIENQSCFDKYPLQVEGRTSDHYQVVKDAFKSRKVPGGHEVFNYRVKLPDRVTCEKCIIQWTYTAGNNWGICKNGTGALGCGEKQETFRNCADVAINRKSPDATNNGLIIFPDEKDYSIHVRIRDPQTKMITFEPLIVRAQVCFSTNNTSLRNDDWCMNNCLRYPPNCPQKDCRCPTECTADRSGTSELDPDIFCQLNCLTYPLTGSCPKWCTCV